jgi:hypothetical protein
MLLHLNFCIEWFESNSKEDSKSFLENALKIWKRKKRKVNHLLSVMAQLSPQPSSVPLRPRPHARPVSFFPASRFGPSPAVSLARASVRAFLPSPSLTPRAHL